MKYLAAYLLANLAGTEHPTAKDVKKILTSAGAETEKERLDTLISELKDKDISELIAEGSKKLASVPSGGAAAPAAGGAAPAAGGKGAAKEEEKAKVEEKEESDDDMGFGLFD